MKKIIPFAWFFSAVITVLLFPAATLSEPPGWKVYNTNNSGIPDNRVVAIGIDLQGNIWTAHSSAYGIGSGCAKFDGENWTVFNTNNSGLPHNNVSAFAFDPQGNVWIGTGSTHSTGGGLTKFDGENWTTYNQANSGLPYDNITHLAFGPDGNLWIGTYGGMAKFDGDVWTTYNTANSGLTTNTITRFSFDTRGNLWVGTWGGGLAKFDGENWTMYNRSNSGLPSYRIVPVAVDPLDNVWIGTYEGSSGGDHGLVKFDGENWTIYNTENSGLPANGIWALAVDGYGNVWAGPSTENPPIIGGLTRYDGKNWTVYDISNLALPDCSIFSLTIDNIGNVWIGTRGGGLVVYSTGALDTIDFNGDEKVDFKDFSVFAQYWYEDKSSFIKGCLDHRYLALLTSYWLKEILPDSLIAYWKLDEIEGDIAQNSVSNNHGILYGDPQWQPTGGMSSGALRFDSVDDYVSTDSVLNPANGVFSVLAWAKGGVPGQTILSQAGGVNWLCADSVGGCLMTELKDSGRGGAPLLSQTCITDDHWHRIGFVWDGSYRHLYIDGAEIIKDEAPLSGLENAEGGLYIGVGSTLSTDTFWLGLIDDIRVYNKVLSPERIEVLTP